MPEASRTAKGTPIVNVLPLETGEAVTAMLHVKSLEEENQFLLMATRMGTVKRVTLQSINTARKSGIRAPEPGGGGRADLRRGHRRRR